jgi:hypothetical protein
MAPLASPLLACGERSARSARVRGSPRVRICVGGAFSRARIYSRLIALQIDAGRFGIGGGVSFWSRAALHNPQLSLRPTTTAFR